jgi:hypothetical protein
VIDNEQGRVCGHVLAWCERNAIAYICPTEVLLEDMMRTLGASRVCLPGSVEERTGPRSIAGRESVSAVDFGESSPTSGLPDISRLDFGDESGMLRSRLNGSAVSPRMELQRLYGGQLA